MPPPASRLASSIELLSHCKQARAVPSHDRKCQPHQLWRDHQTIKPPNHPQHPMHPPPPLAEPRSRATVVQTPPGNHQFTPDR